MLLMVYPVCWNINQKPQSAKFHYFTWSLPRAENLVTSSPLPAEPSQSTICTNGSVISMWPSAVREIHQQWKTSVSLNVWQSSLLTLSADDGKEPQVWVKASSTACYLGPSARAEHAHTHRAKHSQRWHQECVFSLFLLMRENSKSEASVFIFLETLYMQNKS